LKLLALSLCSGRKMMQSIMRRIAADNMIETHEHQGEFKEWWQD
jgi:hypothetical protein